MGKSTREIDVDNIEAERVFRPLLSAVHSNNLLCGCFPVLELVVRKYKNGSETWGYACKCGKVFKEKGKLR